MYNKILFAFIKKSLHNSQSLLFTYKIMGISFELAKLRLANIFGNKETIEFLANTSSNSSEELISTILTMYDAYGPEETHEIFDALNIKIPHIEDRIRNKAGKQLRRFRTELWEYKFPEHSPLSIIQAGINHIVLYPIQTQLGRRLLACIVATFWNPQNIDYFDVYCGLRDQSETQKCLEKAREVDPPVSFILDHAGYAYSNPNFNRRNGPDGVEHMHPKSGGGYHTHIYYHWDFPGLIAMQSILHLVYQFIDESDGETKLQWEQESNNCVKKYSQYVADTLLLALPEVVYELDRPILYKVSKLVAVLTAIRDKGIYAVDMESLDLPMFTQVDYKELFSLMDIKGNDLMSMLRIFLFDLETYKNKLLKWEMATSISNKTLALPHEKTTARQLFSLSCCLNRNNLEIEQLSLAELTSKRAILEKSTDPTNKCEYDLVTQELNLRKLRTLGGLCSDDDLQQLRLSLPYHPDVDKSMVGYRERVADVVGTFFKFTKKRLQQSPKTGMVKREDTKNALLKAGF